LVKEIMLPFFYLYNLFAFIRTAMGTNSVGHFGLMTLWTKRQIHGRQSVMTPSPIPPRLGSSSFRKSHYLLL
jgi:hypothetical protein